MAWSVVAKAAIKLAARSVVATGAENLVNSQIAKYFPNAEGQQLDDIERKLNGIYGLLRDGPFEYPFRGGQCEAVRYDVAVYHRRVTGYEETSTSRYWGPIDKVIVTRTSNNPIRDRIDLICRGDEDDPISSNPVAVQVTTATEAVVEAKIASITPIRALDNCGDPPLFPDEPIPPSIPADFDGKPGGIKFGVPYFDENGESRIPFKVEGDDGTWSLEGSYNPATGDVNLGETVDEDGDGVPDYDKKYPPGGGGGDGTSGDSCVKQRICGEPGSESNAWPITVPDLLTQTDDATYDIESLPQFVAWLARNIDAISGQYPITLEIEDTDPITQGNQSQTISLPNQAEAMAELFGLAYEANTNSELMVNMLFRLIPEVVAAKNSSLTSQDYTQAITNWLGFRTKNVQREIDSNFNPLTPNSLIDFLSPSKYKVQGIEDDDPHTLVEWVQQFKFAAGLVKASLFRGSDLETELSDEVKSVVDEQLDDNSEKWEEFIDALNRDISNLTDRTVSPRPRATSVEDVLDIGTVLPDRETEE